MNIRKTILALFALIPILTIGSLTTYGSFAYGQEPVLAPQIEEQCANDFNSLAEQGLARGSELIEVLEGDEAGRFMTTLNRLVGDEAPRDLVFDKIYIWSPFPGVPLYSIFFFLGNCNQNVRLSINPALYQAVKTLTQTI